MYHVRDNCRTNQRYIVLSWYSYYLITEISSNRSWVRYTFLIDLITADYW
jgi:hypothetical protein